MLSYLWPAQNQALLQKLADKKVNAVAMDAIPRISRAQKMDVLSSMANIAGYRAVIEGSYHFGRFLNGQITAAGKVEPAKVLVIGGGMANTFLAAKGYKIGKSLCENDFLGTAMRIMKLADELNTQILLPRDVVVAKQFVANAPYRVCGIHEIQDDEMILDAGPQSVAVLATAMDVAKTLVWNGPLGAFELEPFDKATVAAARAAAARAKSGKLIAVAGGGDTVAALNHAHAADDFTFVSTAGGAFLEWMEGKALPGVEALKR